jgi:hypothetical protein
MRRCVPLPFLTVTTWCPETRQVVRIHVSERLLDLHKGLGVTIFSRSKRGSA